MKLKTTRQESVEYNTGFNENPGVEMKGSYLNTNLIFKKLIIIRLY
jgi:hypothetical protein